jgi:hypothetical protein
MNKCVKRVQGGKLNHRHFYELCLRNRHREDPLQTEHVMDGFLLGYTSMIEDSNQGWSPTSSLLCQRHPDTASTIALVFSSVVTSEA